MIVESGWQFVAREMKSWVLEPKSTWEITENDGREILQGAEWPGQTRSLVLVIQLPRSWKLENGENYWPTPKSERVQVTID